MTIKECYGSKFWKEVLVEVESAWRPVVINGVVIDQMVTINDKSGQYVVVNKAMSDDGCIGIDEEGQLQHWKLRCKDGILQGQSLKPHVAGEPKQYRDYYGKGQGNGKCK